MTDNEILVAFAENSMNICSTGRKLDMHRNTIRYRLDKIQKETGLNPYNMFQLVELLRLKRNVPINNYECIMNMSVEELALFLANETYRMAKPVCDEVGYGIELQFITALRKKWLESEVDTE